MDYAEKITHYAKKLDERHWLRLVVLFSPGIVLMKIASVLSAPRPVQVGAALILGAGLALYALWDRLKAKIVGEQEIEGEEVEAGDEGGQQTIQSADATKYSTLMNRLVDMCDGDAAAALYLVEEEGLVNPALSYLTAIEQAYRRKEAQIKRRSGS